MLWGCTCDGRREISSVYSVNVAYDFVANVPQLCVCYSDGMLRKWDTENEELQRKLLNELITRMQEIDDTSSVGVIAAQDIVDIVTEHLGPEIYNKGIADAKKLVVGRLADIDIELSTLEQKS